MGKVHSVCISHKKGIGKTPISSVNVIKDFGVENDAHAGPGHRQVSLLADESAQKMRDKGLSIGPGDFGENILTNGVDLIACPVGSRLQIGDVLLEVTQIGKTCHHRCAIYHQAGDCVMPTDGIFCKVLTGGPISSGDGIEVVYDK